MTVHNSWQFLTSLTSLVRHFGDSCLTSWYIKIQLFQHDVLNVEYSCKDLENKICLGTMAGTKSWKSK